MKKIIDEIKAELQKMKASRDEAYIKTYIPWEDNRGFQLSVSGTMRIATFMIKTESSWMTEPVCLSGSRSIIR